ALGTLQKDGRFAFLASVGSSGSGLSGLIDYPCAHIAHNLAKTAAFRLIEPRSKDNMRIGKRMKIRIT
ncbi:MAG TPA: hypothetical protein VK639_14340, partial [Terriglobales bacterium]|nr:hypothetical protein [Terriglobales bacterium]